MGRGQFSRGREGLDYGDPSPGGGVDNNYAPTTKVWGDSCDESYSATKKVSPGNTSSQQETPHRGIKRNSDALGCN